MFATRPCGLHLEKSRSEQPELVLGGRDRGGRGRELGLGDELRRIGLGP